MFSPPSWSQYRRGNNNILHFLTHNVNKVSNICSHKANDTGGNLCHLFLLNVARVNKRIKVSNNLTLIVYVAGIRMSIPVFYPILEADDSSPFAWSSLGSACWMSSACFMVRGWPMSFVLRYRSTSFLSSCVSEDAAHRKDACNHVQHRHFSLCSGSVHHFFRYSQEL